MKTKLILLETPIIVSDEEIKEGDWLINLKSKDFEPFIKDFKYDSNDVWYRKIIAGIPELPSIDFSLLSEADCKKIEWVDVEKLAKKNWKSDKYNEELFPEKTDENTFCAGFYEGFKTAQSLNDKMFSLEDMRNFCEYYTKGITNSIWDSMEEYIQSLQQTSWDVEVMKEGGMGGSNEIWAAHPDEPKIINNSIKIIKVL